jgi:hypothetical protein
MSDIQAVLEAAEADYAAARQRQSQLADESNTARAAATEAAGFAASLLEGAARGDDVTDQQLLDARASAERVKVVEEIAEAKYKNAAALTRKAQANVLTAKAPLIQAEYEAEIEKLIAAAAKVDDALDQVRQALTEFAEQAKAARVAHARGGSFNAEARSAVADNEVLAKAKQLGTLPQANVPQHFGVPEPEVELFQDLDPGKISARRAPITSLTQMIRAAFNRLLLAA